MLSETKQSGVMDLFGIRFFANAITGDFVANKKNNTLAVPFDFVGAGHCFIGSEV
jgi:hypothetical protein